MFDVLDQKQITKSEGTFKHFEEGLIQETRDCDFAIFVLVEQESRGLAGWINDQWVAVVSFKHDHILGRQVVSWQRLRLPAQAVIGC